MLGMGRAVSCKAVNSRFSLVKFGMADADLKNVIGLPTIRSEKNVTPVEKYIRLNCCMSRNERFLFTGELRDRKEYFLETALAPSNMTIVQRTD
jgi:hypothetical protein